MKSRTHFLKLHYKEIIFQVIVFLVLFVFYSFDKHHSREMFVYKIPFFINYALASILINYLLLPKLYYKKKFVPFFIGIALVIGVVICVEELVLEKIFFPTTRGAYFPIFFSLINTLPVMILFVGFKFAWDFNKKQSEIETLKRSIQESELQFLKSQINPHFLFNNLNNLYAYALENSPKTPSIILELSSVLRYMLYDCKEKFVPLTKEITHLQNFTALNELQIEHRGDIKFDTHNITSNYSIAPLILMVFVENAFKHSTASQSEDIFIHIRIEVSPVGELTFVCKNSFLVNTNVDNLSKGIGLQNVQKRLALLYPNAHQLEITDANNTFQVRLTMHLKPTN
jgi:hypothetical protein